MLALGRLAAAARADYRRADDAEAVARASAAGLAELHACEAQGEAAARETALDTAATWCRPEGIGGAFYAVALAAAVAEDARVFDLDAAALNEGMARVLRLLLPVAAILARDCPDVAAAVDVARLFPQGWAPMPHAGAGS